MKMSNRPVWLIVCLVLALAAVASAQERGKDETPLRRGKQSMPNDLLKSLVGSWEGTCRTWFEPGKLADESPVTGKIRPILDGRFFRHEYEAT
ncbi:MAG TPA: DUF1579 family protein, partial [Pirellulales bacterium]|nr:DUF1579 family protein [Pirellulales bacterium]